MPSILVDKKLCTRCKVCSLVCPAAIICPADENRTPWVPEAKADMCISCGHCEAHCPSGALVLDFRLEERVVLPVDAGVISPENLGFYLKKRRSVRHFTPEPVPQEKIEELLGIACYAASGGNRQPVEWLVIHEPLKVQRLAALTMDWMKTLQNSNHPMSNYIPKLLMAWEYGYDPICRKAPHLLIAHIPEDNLVASVDAIIALTYVDIAAPAFGLGTCWAGFLSMAAATYEPLQKELALAEGRKYAYGLMFGRPQHKVHGIPRRNLLRITWR